MTAPYHCHEITPNQVELSSGEQISTRTVICTGGNAPHPIIKDLAIPHDRGRILVDATFKVTGSTNLWALGDATLVPDVTGGELCPPTAQYAIRQGWHGAHNIVATLRGNPIRDFQFKGLGQWRQSKNIVEWQKIVDGKSQDFSLDSSGAGST